MFWVPRISRRDFALRGLPLLEEADEALHLVADVVVLIVAFTAFDIALRDDVIAVRTNDPIDHVVLLFAFADEVVVRVDRFARNCPVPVFARAPLRREVARLRLRPAFPVLFVDVAVVTKPTERLK